MSRRLSVAHAAQRLVTVMLLILFAATSAVALRVQASEPECGMSCCRRVKSPKCCKRHLHGSGKGVHVRAAARGCQTGCSLSVQPVAAQGILPIPAARRVPDLVYEPLVISRHRSACSPVLNALLHQRPPPARFL
jgi:hypothetical protein